MKNISAYGIMLIAASGCVGSAEPEAEQRSAVTEALVTMDEGDYVIKSVRSGKCIDIASSSRESGAKVQQWTCNSTSAQIFRLTAVGDGYYSIKNVNSMKVLDVKDVSRDPAAPLHQWDYVGGQNQQFRFEAVSDGQLAVYVRHTGYVLDIPGGSVDDGAPVTQYPYSGAQQQLFRFERTTGGPLGALPGLSWPASQVFPSFGSIDALDVIEIGGRAADVRTLVVTLEGLVNRTKPRLYVRDNSGDDDLWLRELGAPQTAVTDPLALVAKYKGELGGIVVYDNALLDTVNLATTMAGQMRAVVASPALATTLRAAPYNLPVLADLRDQHFSSPLAVYQYEFDNYSWNATHRLIVGLNPSISGHLRDYAVATGAMVVWLNPNDSAQNTLLQRFFGLLGPNSPYLGWWLDEGAGVNAAARFGVPVYAADFSMNLSVLGGSPRGSAPVPPPPAPPKLENKVYVSIFMSDGDNLQEDQHLVPNKWANSARGSVPIAWTISPALVDVAPVILRYFQRTATDKDVLVTGPSGLGYTYPRTWLAGVFDQYAEVSGRYMAAAGLNVVTLWNDGVDMTDADAHSYVQHVPGLLGMTIQNDSRELRLIDDRVPMLRFHISYGDNASILERGINDQLATWAGDVPRFVAVQGNMNMGGIQPGAFNEVQANYAQNSNVVFVRPDHFFKLLNQAKHPAQHETLSGDYNGDGKTDSLFYYEGNGDWWMGLSNGTTLDWHSAGNMTGFGRLLDGQHPFYPGDYNGDGKSDVLVYSRTQGKWWMGLSNGTTLAWHEAAITTSFGDMLSGSRRVLTGDFTGDGKTDVLFYYNGDSNWWMGVSNGDKIEWHGAGNTSSFSNLLDGQHQWFTGDFDGDGKTDVAFYYNADGNWFVGRSDGNTLAWRSTGNTRGFGNLLDGGHRLLSGDFTGDGKTDVLFHWNGDGNWWMGVSDGSTFNWHYAATTSGMGDLVDLRHRLFTGDFDGDHKTDVLAYDGRSGAWNVGRSDGTNLVWSAAGAVAGYGDLLDPSRLLFLGDYNGDGRTDVTFYYNGDGNWFTGNSSGSAFAWHAAGNTRGFGDLIH